MGAIAANWLDRYRSAPTPTVHKADGDPMLGLTPGIGEIAGTFALLIFYGIAIAYGSTAALVANYVGPVILSVVVGLAVYKMVTTNRYTLWSPLLWYRVGVVGYLGVGSLVTLFLNAETRDLLASFFDFFPRDVLKFNLVVAIFHATILLFTLGIIGPLRARSLSGKTLRFISPCNLTTETIGFTFLGVGSAANYLLIYPATLQIVSFTVPNIIVQIGQLAYVGYFLIGYWALRNNRPRWVWLILALTIIDSIVGLIQLSKYAAIFPAMMLPIAYLYHRVTLRRLLLVIGIMVPFYFGIADVVTDARGLVTRSNEGRAVLSETTQVLSARATGDNQARDDLQDYQIGWARLSYVNAGTFAISLYDQGIPGDTLRDIFIVWIPRLVYPDKPVITDIGREFTFRANGNYNSSTSPSIPAEAYWTFGWLGIVLFAALTAPILALWSIYNVVALQREAWHLLLVVALGLRTGSRIDGMLVPDIIGPISAAVVLHVLLYFANRLLPPRTDV
ncbi:MULTISPECIES: hypothetical protein [unclassified Sphingomonas]|uniref:hypothetical protein n=1 Tax=unclassified Sphingomonas TaxID=196159 RepID=UPI000835DD4E|nr:MULTISPECIES: hypothetical protein [unclassified Sphingomonas]